MTNVKWTQHKVSHGRFVVVCDCGQQEKLKIMTKTANEFRTYGLSYKIHVANYLWKIKIIWYRLNELSKVP